MPEGFSLILGLFSCLMNPGSLREPEGLNQGSGELGERPGTQHNASVSALFPKGYSPNNICQLPGGFFGSFFARPKNEHPPDRCNSIRQEIPGIIPLALRRQSDRLFNNTYDPDQRLATRGTGWLPLS